MCCSIRRSTAASSSRRNAYWRSRRGRNGAPAGRHHADLQARGQQLRDDFALVTAAGLADDAGGGPAAQGLDQPGMTGGRVGSRRGRDPVEGVIEPVLGHVQTDGSDGRFGRLPLALRAQGSVRGSSLTGNRTGAQGSVARSSLREASGLPVLSPPGRPAPTTSWGGPHEPCGRLPQPRRRRLPPTSLEAHSRKPPAAGLALSDVTWANIQVKNPAEHGRDSRRSLIGSFLLRGGFAGQVAALSMTRWIAVWRRDRAATPL
jgi:hypothetical protein